MNKLFHHKLYNGCNYLSMLGLKVIYVNNLIQQLIITSKQFWGNLKKNCSLQLFPWLCQHIEARQNSHDFAGDIFKCIFFNENFWNLYKNFRAIWSLRFNWQCESIGSDNGLVPVSSKLSEPMLAGHNIGKGEDYQLNDILLVFHIPLSFKGYFHKKGWIFILSNLKFM